MQEFTTVGID